MKKQDRPQIKSEFGTIHFMLSKTSLVGDDGGMKYM